MSSKSKEARQEQKIFWESKLKQRLSVLADRGIEPGKIAGDATVRRIRASMRETENRLKAIDGMDKKSEEMAGIKAEKMASPQEKKGKKKKEEASQKSKRQMKKKKKKEGKDKD